MIVTLTEIKSRLNIHNTVHDTFLTENLNLVQSLVETYCRRKFETANYVQTFYAQDYDTVVSSLLLYSFPIITLSSFKLDGVASTDYRLNKPTGKLISKENLFFVNADEIEVTYSAGYDNADIPPAIKEVIYSTVEERYNKHVSGVALNFGSDVQRVSIPGTISIDFDYSLTSNERTNTFGTILGSRLNLLDMYRSERIAAGGSLVFLA